MLFQSKIINVVYYKNPPTMPAERPISEPVPDDLEELPELELLLELELLREEELL